MSEHHYWRVKEDEIDLVELLLYFWSQRFFVAKIVATFLVLGGVVVLLSRVEYQANTTLKPESQSSQSSAANLLSQYGGILGIQGGGQTGSEGISAGLYPDILASTPYQVELMNKSLYFSSMDTTMTVHEYFRDVYPPSTLDYIEKYTIGLPGQIIGLFKGDNSKGKSDPIVNKISRDSIVALSSQQRGTIGKLKDRINIVQDEGLITITAELPDPQAAAELGQAGINLLKEYVREYRTQKANEELKFAKEQVKRAKQRFEEAQMKLANFRDSNINLATARAQTKEQELQSQYDLAFDLYNNLTQNLEQAKLKVQENTPVFTTIEPIQVPTGNSKPDTVLIIFATTFIGLFLGITLVTGKRISSFIKEKISEIR